VSDANEETWSSGALREVARGQRRVLWLILIGLLVSVPPVILVGRASPREFDEAMNLAGLVSLGFAAAQLYALWTLSKALRSSAPWLYCLLAFVPCISMLSLLYLNQSATNLLKANGIKVGFMGASLADFGQVSFGPDECHVCGKYLKNADERLECPKCRINICDSCAVQTRVGGGMVESFTVTCPKCKAELVETRTKDAPAEEDFDDEEA